MLLELFLFLVGVSMLVAGAWLLVTGGARIAALLGVAPVVVGLTVVAFGTSAPELFVSLVAALRGNAELMLGNVIGSNLANIGLILGLTSLVRPVTIDPSLSRRERTKTFGTRSTWQWVNGARNWRHVFSGGMVTGSWSETGGVAWVVRSTSSRRNRKVFGSLRSRLALPIDWGHRKSA